MDSIWSAAPKATSIAFQMDGPESATYCGAISVAIAHHAKSVELWPSTGSQPGFTSVPTATLLAWEDTVAPRHGSYLLTVHGKPGQLHSVRIDTNVGVSVG